MIFVNRRPNGFSLIEMLISVALLGMVIVGINGLVVNSYSNLRLLKAEAFIKIFNLNVDAFLNSQKACSSTLVAINPMLNGKVLPSVKNMTGGNVYTTPVTGMNEAANQITLRRMAIANYSAGGGGGKVNFDIQMSYEYVDGAVVIPIVRLINISADVDASNNVITCSSFMGLNPESLFVKVEGNEIKTGDLIITNDLLIGSGAGDASLVELVDSNRHVEFYTPSDRILKENLIPLASSVEKLRDLKAYRYRFKSSKKWHIGFLAQEVEKVAPHAVMTNAEGYKMVNYKSLLPYVWEYHKSVYAKRQKLISRLEVLEGKTESK